MKRKITTLILGSLILLSIACSNDNGLTSADPPNNTIQSELFNQHLNSSTGSLVSYKTFIPATNDEAEEICKNKPYEHRMQFSDQGSTSIYNWYLTYQLPIEESDKIDSGVDLYLPTPGVTFYLFAEAYDNPNQPFAERPKHGKVITPATCDFGEPGDCPPWYPDCMDD